MLTCPACGFEPDTNNPRNCPKCETPLRPRKTTTEDLIEVDVAHAGETVEEALEKLDKAIRFAMRTHCRGLKVIHGRGSATGVSRLKPPVVAAMKRTAQIHGGKVVPDRNNPGAHLLWFE